MSTDSKPRRTPKRKRTYHGNQWTKKAAVDVDVLPEPSCSSVVDELHNDKTSETSVSEQNATPTRSEIKLQNLYNILKDSSDEEEEDEEGECEDNDSEAELCSDQVYGYRFIDIEILNQNIVSKLCCGFCRSSVRLIEVSRKGLGSQLAFHCDDEKCNKQESFTTCPESSVGNSSVYTVNRRAAFAMRSIGCDLAELQTFCGVMDIPAPVKKRSHNIINKSIQKAACSVQEESMSAAADTELQLGIQEETDTVANIDISFDGTYMTRGQFIQSWSRNCCRLCYRKSVGFWL